MLTLTILSSLVACLSIGGTTHGNGNRRDLEAATANLQKDHRHDRKIIRARRRQLWVLRDQSRRWPEGKVFYALDPGWDKHTDAELFKATIRAGIEEINHSGGCVTISHINSPEAHDWKQKHGHGNLKYILVVPAAECSSETGYVFNSKKLSKRLGNAQVLKLQSTWTSRGSCFQKPYTRAVVHEFLHALGFGHTHARWDRDDHISVPRNIWGMAKGTKTGGVYTTYGLPYDFRSIMHYSQRGGKWRYKDGDRRRGQGYDESAHMSEQDKLLLKKMYCDGGETPPKDEDDSDDEDEDAGEKSATMEKGPVIRRKQCECDGHCTRQRLRHGKVSWWCYVDENSGCKISGTMNGRSFSRDACKNM